MFIEHITKVPIFVMYDVQLLTLNIPVVPVTFWWLIRFSTVENLNSFDILYSKTDDFGNWKDLTISLTKPTDDTKYSHYVIYTGQGNQITNSILVTSTTHLDLYFDCYQYSNPGRVGVAFATFVNSTTVKLKILEGQASGDGIVKILAFKKV